MRLVGEICLTILFTRVSGNLFLKQPQNVTVKESETAIFKCLLSNDSFIILWLINGSDAEFEEFRRKGVSVVSINTTWSELHIPAHRQHNNTQVHCAALLYQNYEFLDYELSAIAILEVDIQLLSVASHQSGLSTTSHIAHYTIIPSMTVSYMTTTGMTLTCMTSNAMTLVTDQPHLPERSTRGGKILLLLSLSTGGGVLLFILMVVIFILSIITRKYRKIKPQQDLSEPVYATIPEKKADNEAIQRVKRKIFSSETIVECYENPAYATTGK